MQPSRCYGMGCCTCYGSFNYSGRSYQKSNYEEQIIILKSNKPKQQLLTAVSKNIK